MNHLGCSTLPKPSPTVIPAKFFLSTEDAEVLHKAIKGLGTDEKAIIKVLAKRSLTQRLEIASQFKKLHTDDLVEQLKKELSGDFKHLIVALLTPRDQFYAEELHRAMCGLGTDEDILIEVLCTLSNSEICGIKHSYYKVYQKSLESDIKGDTSGYFKRLLISLCSAERDECKPVNPEDAKADAESLYKAGEKQWGTDESTFTKILCRRNYAQLRLIFDEYETLTGHAIEKAIEDEFAGDIKDGLLGIVESVKNKAGFFAKSLYKSMKGLGTSDRNLIRVIVTRVEVDMGDIKKEYEKMYSESLADAIKGDTSGDYKKCLLTLIGEE